MLLEGTLDPDVVDERVESGRHCWKGIGRDVNWKGIGRVGSRCRLEGLDPDVVAGRVGSDVDWKEIGRVGSGRC